MSYFGLPNRYLCSVIEEMRDQLKALNENSLIRYKNITALMLEEVQTHANHMEAGLDDWNDFERMREKKKKLKNELNKLEKKIEKIKEDLEEEGE